MQSADSNSRLRPKGSPPPDSSPVCLPAHSTDALPRPECLPFFGNPVSSTIQATTAPSFCIAGITCLHLLEQYLVTPWSFGHQMMQRLSHRLHVHRIQTCSHRLDALAFTRQQQSLAVVLQRSMPILVPRGFAPGPPVGRGTVLPLGRRGQP